MGGGYCHGVISTGNRMIVDTGRDTRIIVAFL